MAVYPTERATKGQRKGLVAPGGGFGVFRPSQGPSGTWHWGLDIGGRAGEAVVAPEHMSVEAVWDFGAGHLEGTHPTFGRAFTGYGPAGVLARGDSGVYHLLAHLDPLGWDASQSSKVLPAATDGAIVNLPGVGESFAEGQQVGRMPTNVGASGPHVHWEVRKEPIDSPATRPTNTFDPDIWVSSDGRTLIKTSRIPSGIPWWVWAAVGAMVYMRRRR